MLLGKYLQANRENQMQFVQGLPQGVFVGQTQIQHPQALRIASES